MGFKKQESGKKSLRNRGNEGEQTSSSTRGRKKELSQKGKKRAQVKTAGTQNRCMGRTLKRKNRGRPLTPGLKCTKL